MPSRLGDDPLARAGRGTAKPGAEADAMASPVALDSLGGSMTSQPEIRSDSDFAAISLQKSSNDIFFLRRGEGKSPELTTQVEQKTTEPMDTTEISEVSEIPEMREVAAAPIVGSERDAEAVAEPSQPREAEGEVGAQGAVEIASPETVAPAETGEPVAQPATIAPGQEPVVLSAPAPDPSQGNGTEPEEGGGLVKKFFDKLGK